MNARLRKLLEQRATAWSAVQDIQARRAAAGYEDTAEDGETYTRSLDDVERLGRQIEDEERSERLAAVMNAPADDVRSTNPRAGDGPGEDISDEYRAAFANYMRRGMTGLNGDEQRLLQEGFVKDAEGRAQAAGTGAAGGYTVPQEFRNKMVETLKAFGGILSIAEVLNTSTGAKLPWPTNNDTANEGGLLSENTAVTEQDMVFGQADLEAHMYTSKLVRVSYQLLQDSAFNLEAWLPVKARRAHRTRLGASLRHRHRGRPAPGAGHRADEDPDERRGRQGRLRRPGRPGALGRPGLPGCRAHRVRPERPDDPRHPQDQGHHGAPAVGADDGRRRPVDHQRSAVHGRQLDRRGRPGRQVDRLR